jgi:hypothetical protein
MRTLTTTSLIAAFLAALLLAPGCEDSPLTAGANYKMILFANPTALRFDPAHPDPPPTASIVATIVSDTGIPQKGYLVYFSSNGGVLSSGTQGIKTDANGAATDTLTVGAQDPPSITVTATSTTLTQNVTVTKTIVGANHPPVATIVASPTVQQAAGRPVGFDGSTSSDPDAGDYIAHYKWVVTSSNPDDPAQNPIVQEGASVSSISFAAFTNPQTLTVALTVTDHNNASTSASISYNIVARLCSDNVKPVAVIAGAATQAAPPGAVGATVPFLLDGTLSTDAETAIQTYTWTCGNGTAPVVPPGGDGSTVTCNYTVQSASHTYPATLVVTDQGFGLPALECQQSSIAATVQVVVAPATGLRFP